MKKTLAQLKRDAKAGKIYAEMIERYGATEIPERLKGKRQIVDANSVGITFLNASGEKSELRIESASLVDYTDKNIIVYNAGLRDLTDDEKNAFNQWQRNHFFVDKGYEYLLGHEKRQGKKYDLNSSKVWDNRIQGEVMLKYALC